MSKKLQRTANAPASETATERSRRRAFPYDGCVRTFWWRTCRKVNTAEVNAWSQKQDWLQVFVKSHCIGMHAGGSDGALARQLWDAAAITSVNGVAGAQTGVCSDNRVGGSPQGNSGATVVDIGLKRPARFLLKHWWEKGDRRSARSSQVA